MTPWRRHLRRARFAAITAVAVVLIAAAVFVGLVQLLLPLATRHPDFVARQLSERLHRPVSFAAIESEWQPSGPLLTVRDLTLGATHVGGQSITLPHAALKFDFGAWLRPAHRWITLRLNDMELQVEHARSGWQVVGFSNASGSSRVSLQTLPVDLDLRNLRVDVVDGPAQHTWKLFAPRLRVVNVGDRIRFGGIVRQVGTQQMVTVSGAMNAAAHDYVLHAATGDLDLADAARGIDLHGYVVRRGSGKLELWARWRGSELDSAALRYDLRGLDASGPDGRSLALDALAGVARAVRVKGGWDFAWRGPGKPRANIDAAGGVLAQLRGQRGAWQVAVAARNVAAAPWLRLLAMAPQAPQALIDWAAHAQPRLTVDAAALAWHQSGGYDATVRFSGLRAAAEGAIPGIALEHGVVRADRDAWSLELPPQAATVALTHVFRKPFVFTRLGGTLTGWRDAGHWNVAVPALRFDTGTLAGSARARLQFPGDGQPPFISAYAVVDRAKVGDAHLFWPYRSMPPHTVAWLDHALVDGEVTSGRVLVRGDLGDWPFRAHEGRFEAAGSVRDAVFDYADEWPRVTGVDAAVDFVDNRMGIVATHATTQGVTATHAVATIPDLGNGVLGLDVRAEGSGAELLDFVRHSPVGANAGEALAGLTLGGSGKAAVKLSIPLGQPENFALDGRLDLAHADVAAPKWNLALKNLGGAFLIAGKGFRAPGLSVTFRGTPAKLALAVGSGVADPSNIVEAALDVSTSPQQLAQGFPDLDGLLAHLHGVAPFHVSVDVAAGQGGAPAVPTLGIDSTLAGVALDFPAPLAKPAAATLPLALKLRLPPAGAPLAVSLGDVLRVRGRLADAAHRQATALAINFGALAPANAPAAGLIIGGHAGTLDLSGWIHQALAGGAGSTFPALKEAEVGIDHAQVFGTDLGALDFRFDAGATADTLGFNGAALAGTVSVPTSNLMAHGISAKLARLHWPEAPPSSSSGPPQPPSASSPIAPADVPPLHVAIADLRLGSTGLGATTIESAPAAHGMHVARFESTGADFTIQAHGDWSGSAAASQSHMVIDIVARDFGHTLDAFGLRGLLAGGENARVHIDGSWPGAPSGFSLAWMQGTLDVEMGEGRLLAVKPGFGRLLGLLSLRELPSRLLLHFGDVFKSGFGFDHIKASFALKDGSAWTKDLLIKAPAAQIAMRGRTGFRNHDFDLTLDVTPHVGGTLPVVGAVIGGPVGAAAGLVVQGLIGKGINKAAGSIYHVTGGWDKPKIVEVGSHGHAPASASSIAVPASAALPASASVARPLPAAAGSG